MSLSFQQYGVEEEIDKIRDVSLDFGNIDIIDPDTKRELQELANTNLDGINFASYYLQLDKNPTDPTLTSVASNLDNLAAQVSIIW